VRASTAMVSAAPHRGQSHPSVEAPFASAPATSRASAMGMSTVPQRAHVARTRASTRSATPHPDTTRPVATIDATSRNDSQRSLCVGSEAVLSRSRGHNNASGARSSPVRRSARTAGDHRRTLGRQWYAFVTSRSSTVTQPSHDGTEIDYRRCVHLDSAHWNRPSWRLRGVHRHVPSRSPFIQLSSH